MIDHLQRGAQGIGRGKGGLIRFTMQMQQKPPHRRGRIAAIVHQVIPGVIPVLGDIAAKGNEQVGGGGKGHAGGQQAFAQAPGHGKLRIVPSHGPGQRKLEQIKALELLIGIEGRIVSNVVNGAGPGIIGRHMRAQIGRDQP